MISQNSTEVDAYSSSGSSTSPLLRKANPSYTSIAVSRETEIAKLLQASLTELTNNPNNLENRQNIQALIPISVLLDEMRSDYSKNLDTIALALGPAKAKGLLGGFISNLLKDQDEGGINHKVEEVPEEMQVMMTLLQGLPKLIKSIGGPASGLVLMQPLVETLPDRQKEETKQMYLKAVVEIYQKMKEEKAAQMIGESYLDEKVERFTNGTPFEQLSAVQLIAALYFVVSQELQSKWVKSYTQLVNIKEVKKRSLMLISELMKKCERQSELTPFLMFIQSETPSIPEVFKGQILYSMPVIFQKKKVLDQTVFRNVMKVLMDVTQIEKSHIQTVFLEILPELLEYEESPTLLQNYITIFKQNETETKNKSCAILDKIIRFLHKTKNSAIFESVLLRVQELINDKSTNTKLLITDNLLLLLKEDSPFVEQERYQFVKLLMDIVEQSDGEFRYKFLQKLPSFESLLKIIKSTCKISIASELNYKIGTIICSIQTQKNWRMRQQCCALLSKFLVDLAKYNLEERILIEASQCIRLSLSDRIANVREEASKSLNSLCQVSKNLVNCQNIVGNILKEQIEVYQSQNYLIRLSLVLGLKEMFSCVEFTEECLLSKLLKKVVQDRVPNVKLALIETIFHQYQYQADKRVRRWIPQFKQCLKDFGDDSDNDVKQSSSTLIQIL